MHWRIRGSWWLLNLLERFGALDVIVQYTLAGNIRLDLPLFRNLWEPRYVKQYEQPLVDLFAERCKQFSSFVLFDRGADIGTFSAQVCSRKVPIGRIIAFEPNPDTAVFLRRNLSFLPYPSDAVACAPSSFVGSGRLESPDYAYSDSCGRFLVPGDGPIPVTTLDTLGVRGKDVAIKIDVEGSELDVLKGAADTILSARNCVVAWEAHPLVAKRTNRDPVECLRFLLSLRPFSFCIAETGEAVGASSSLISEDAKDVVNVVGWTNDDESFYTDANSSALRTATLPREAGSQH